MAEENKIYAGVRLLDVPYHLDRIYTYLLSDEIDENNAIGTLVTVPFGGANRTAPAVITSITNKYEGEYTVKTIEGVLGSGPLLTKELMDICSFLVSHTLCTWGEAVKSVIPSQAMTKLNDYFCLGEDYSDEKANSLDEFSKKILEYISLGGVVSLQKIKKEFGPDSQKILSKLMRQKLVKKTIKVKEASNIKHDLFVSIRDEISKDAVNIRGSKQLAIFNYLLDNGRTSIDELSDYFDKNVKNIVLSLEEKGIVFVEKIESYRNPYITECVPKIDTSSLSVEQKEAYDNAASLYEKDEAAAMLLHGVTGSGKTRVIKAMIDRVVEDGKSVIVLVPEISLTPQTVSFFCGCYGERVSVIHSALSQGERFDAWRRIRDGLSDIVIGTRSAVFAPVKNLGMIVIDEEQEHTYKSDTDPKYLAHDVASFRCGKNNAFMLLSSATPSLVSYYKATTGKYTLQKMLKRYGNAKLPDVVIDDMRDNIKEGNSGNIGRTLTEKLIDSKESGNQSIVFLNRRGYSSSVICNMCGETIKCPNCSVSLTYHTFAQLENTDNPEEYQRIRASRGRLSCHYCGYGIRVPDKCPSCGSLHFRFVGCGTQQVEEEIDNLNSNIRVLRMDYDTTQGKDSHRKILNSFREGKADVLLGTQMVTKGHDFPKVNLVGVINADSSLYLDDYRAAEKTFSMLTQVIGRAGRADASGVAVIQTLNPESETLKLAAKQDYEKFYESEIRLRKALVFPPFCDLITITLSSKDETQLSASAVKLNEYLNSLMKEKYNDIPLTVYGPFEAPVYKVQNVCRMRMVFKCRLSKRVRLLVSDILCEFGKQNSKNVIISADINPSNL